MAVYEYHCDTHGTFDALRPMAAYAEPCPCPDCGTPAPRVMLTPPRLGARDRGRIRAHAINERSADSPRRSSHGPGCACCSPGGGKARAARAADGAKGFPGRRPWMISH
jgi:putative FmdB family regulatory protein